MNIKHLRYLLIINNINFNEEVINGHKTITVVSTGMDILDITEDGTARITALKEQVYHFLKLDEASTRLAFPCLSKYDDFQQARLSGAVIYEVTNGCYKDFNFDPGSLADIQEMRNTWAAMERLYLETEIIERTYESKS